MSKPSQKAKWTSYGFALFIGLIALVIHLDVKASDEGWAVSTRGELHWSAVPLLVLMGHALGVQFDADIIDRISRR